MAQEFLYYGEVISDHGLAPVAEALTGCSWRIELRRSAHDGTLYLRSASRPEIRLAMDSGQSQCFLFSGEVEGTAKRALALLGEFSQCLATAGLVHRVEIYDEADAVVGYFNHQWPSEPPA